jgi:hypothetical protein
MLLCDIPLVQVVLAERHDSNRKGHLDPLSTLRSTLSSRPASIGWNSGFDLFVERSLGCFRVSRGFFQRCLPLPWNIRSSAGFGVLALTVGFGLAAARYGDKFWYSVLRFY